MAKRGDAGDATAQGNLLHTTHIWVPAASNTGGDHPKDLTKRLSGGDHPEAISSGDHPEALTKRLAGVGPKIRSAGVDPMVAAASFYNIYTLAVKPTALHRLPGTVESPPVILESPRDPRITILFRDYARRRSWASRCRNLKAPNDNQEDQSDKHEDQSDKHEDQSEKKQLEEDRRKFEEDKRLSILSLEEDKKKFEEYKNEFFQKAAAAEEERKGTMLSTTVSKIETADKHFSLVEKVSKTPERIQELGKSISENIKIVKKFSEDDNKVIHVVKQFGKVLTALSLGLVRDQIRDKLGLGGEDSVEGLNDDGVSTGGLNNVEGNAGGNAPNGALKVANATGNGPNGVPKVGNGTGNGPNIGGSVPKVGNGTGNGPNIGGSVPKVGSAVTDGLNNMEGNAGGNAPNGALKVANATGNGANSVPKVGNGTGNGPNIGGSVPKVGNGTGNGPNIGGSVPKVGSAVTVAHKVSASNAVGTKTFSVNDGGVATVSPSMVPVDVAATGGNGGAVGVNAGGPAIDGGATVSATGGKPE